MNSTHTWRFFRAGGFDQVRLDTGADLVALEQLDQKLWVALACPTSGLEFDSKTLNLIDTDKDGRIRAPELLAAVKWAANCLKNPDDLLKSSPELPLSAINDATPEGKQLLASARQLLANLGKPSAGVVTLDDTADTVKIFSQTQFNGDGIIPAESAEDEATKAAVNDIIACMGAETDRSGKPGVNQAKVEQFFAAAQAYSDWWKKAETDPTILPLQSATASAAEAFEAVRVKVDDYFTRCRLAAFDPRALNALNREEKEYLVFAGKDLTPASAEIAGFPLAQVGAGKPLPLAEGLNPAWAERIASFQKEVVAPLFKGKAAITESEWVSMKARFIAYQTWLASKAGAMVEKLGLPRVRELLAGKAREKTLTLVAKDKALETEVNTIASVEKLVRYHRDLYQLVNNFVSFRGFYSRREKAIFQAGTLYLDQRSCELCLMVEDAGKHAIMATLSGTYLAYCECVRKGTGEKMQIVAAFTDGDSDNLMVGRNGIFYDRKGRDWDATITKILDNPISVRQAFWAPYKKVARMVQEQIAKRAAAADEASTARLAQAAAKIEKASASGQAPPPPEPAKPKVDPGMIAALSVGAAGRGRHGRRHRHRIPTSRRLDARGRGGHHPPYLRSLHAPGLAETAQTQSRPDPGRQRLGRKRQGQGQCAVRRGPDPGRRSAAGFPTRHRGPLRRKAPSLGALSVPLSPGDRRLALVALHPQPPFTQRRDPRTRRGNQHSGRSCRHQCDSPKSGEIAAGPAISCRNKPAKPVQIR